MKITEDITRLTKSVEDLKEELRVTNETLQALANPPILVATEKVVRFGYRLARGALTIGLGWLG